MHAKLEGTNLGKYFLSQYGSRLEKIDVFLRRNGREEPQASNIVRRTSDVNYHVMFIIYNSKEMS